MFFPSYIRDEDTRNSKAVRYVGNVTEDTEITFEFGIKKASGKKAEKKAGKMFKLRGLSLECLYFCGKNG